MNMVDLFCILDWLDLGNLEMKVNSPEFHFQVSTSTMALWSAVYPAGSVIESRAPFTFEIIK